MTKAEKKQLKIEELTEAVETAETALMDLEEEKENAIGDATAEIEKAYDKKIVKADKELSKLKAKLAKLQDNVVSE